MRSLMIGVAAVCLLSACGGGPKGSGGNSGLSEDAYNKIRMINEGMADNESAMQLAFGTFQPSFKAMEVSQKVRKLADLLQAGGCTTIRKDPAEDYSRSWDGQNAVYGASCPITLQQNWSYDSRNHTWKVGRDSFTVNTEEFKKESPVQSYSVNDGFLTATNSGTNTRITGAISYYNFKVQDIGLVMVNIRTEQNYNAVRGGGTIEMVMEARKSFKANVFISWYSGRSTIFRINGKTVDQKVIEELFSSFGLMELIDRSLKMRY